MIFDDNDKKANLRLEQILENIENKDKETLKSLFSKQALSEAENIEERIIYLFDIFQGTVESWERTGFSSETSSEYGKKSIMLLSWYTIITNEDKYYFFVVDYIKDDFKSNNIGVYMLQVMKYIDSENQPSWQERLCAGIYKPEE